MPRKGKIYHYDRGTNRGSFVVYDDAGNPTEEQIDFTRRGACQPRGRLRFDDETGQPAAEVTFSNERASHLGIKPGNEVVFEESQEPVGRHRPFAARWAPQARWDDAWAEADGLLDEYRRE